MSMTELDHPHLPTRHGFQKGHPRYGGRKKGSRNKFGGDLREAVVAAIQETAFVTKDDQGNPIGTGVDGCKGFVKWLALHEPKTAAALFARVLPYYIDTSGEVPEVASEAEIEVMLKELGLPVGMIEHMQTAPAPLDLDEHSICRNISRKLDRTPASARDSSRSIGGFFLSAVPAFFFAGSARFSSRSLIFASLSSYFWICL
jgi:hypothetical protein